MDEKRKPIWVSEEKHPYYGCVGYIKREHVGMVGAHVFVPDGDGYKVERVALFRRQFTSLFYPSEPLTFKAVGGGDWSGTEDDVSMDYFVEVD